MPELTCCCHWHPCQDHTPPAHKQFRPQHHKRLYPAIVKDDRQILTMSIFMLVFLLLAHLGLGAGSLTGSLIDRELVRRQSPPFHQTNPTRLIF